MVGGAQRGTFLRLRGLYRRSLVNAPHGGTTIRISYNDLVCANTRNHALFDHLVGTAQTTLHALGILMSCDRISPLLKAQ